MVSLQTIRTANARLRTSLGPGAVAVFVGGTAGIGEHTLRAFVKNTDSAHIYVIGRNETVASRILSELKGINASHEISFIKSDVSLLKNVDVACKEISSKEKKVNFLFLSPGILAMKGRDDTSEHIPRKLALHYYSRMRFIMQLFPLLTARSTIPTRVLSVLGAGYEYNIDVSDLALQKSYSSWSCAAHATTMTSLAFHRLSHENPAISFVHSNPGAVSTELGNDSGWAIKAFKGIVSPLAKIFFIVTTPEESGERHLWALTSDENFGATQKSSHSSSSDSAGEEYSNAYLIGIKGEKTGNYKVLQPMLKDGYAEKIWSHTTDLVDVVVRDGTVSK